MRACRKATSKILPRPFATAIRTEANIPTAVVGLITEPEQPEHIIASGEAEAVFVARAMLRNPQWALMASENLANETISGSRWSGVGLFSS